MLNFYHLKIARFLYACYHPKITGPILKVCKKKKKTKQKNPTRDRAPNKGEGAAGCHGHFAVAPPPLRNYTFATAAFMESCLCVIVKDIQDIVGCFTSIVMYGVPRASVLVRSYH